ncbi:MAG TPA: hypothetical protein VJ253_06105, partial [Dehalococcoidia bacterium]|nr:hypothetical protein [Dehalococcoidia bacterium]
MGGARHRIGRRLRRVWDLPWRLKGPFLAALIGVIALAVTGSIVATRGDHSAPMVKAAVQSPTPAATATPSPVPTATPVPPTPT